MGSCGSACSACAGQRVCDACVHAHVSETHVSFFGAQSTVHAHGLFACLQCINPGCARAHGAGVTGDQPAHVNAAHAAPTTTSMAGLLSAFSAVLLAAAAPAAAAATPAALEAAGLLRPSVLSCCLNFSPFLSAEEEEGLETLEAGTSTVEVAPGVGGKPGKGGMAPALPKGDAPMPLRAGWCMCRTVSMFEAQGRHAKCGPCAHAQHGGEAGCAWRSMHMRLRYGLWWGPASAAMLVQHHGTHAGPACPPMAPIICFMACRAQQCSQGWRQRQHCHLSALCRVPRVHAHWAHREP